MESSSSRPSKKAKLPTNGTQQQVPVCLVDRCISDLSKCRDYHRRHKVCELHSKTARVFINGREQRFSQQCSRFHSLGEFDEGKRSCRKRLDGHNRRRRKPQPDSLSLSSARLFSDHQGTRYLRFGSSQVFPTSAATSAWADETVKAENSILDFINNRSLHNPVIDSDGALSLLSSLPLCEATPEIGSSHVVHLQAEAQSSVPSLSYDHDGCLGMKPEPIGSVLTSNNSSHVFQIGPDDVGSFASGSHDHTLPFSWQ